MEENGESINHYDDDEMSIKAEPEVVFEIDESLNWTGGHYANENIEENDESTPEMSKSRRRSRRTRFRNLRYRSLENDHEVEEIITPDDTNDTRKNDEDFLLQEPSSSTSTKKMQPRVMLKRNRIPPSDSLEQVLKEIGLYAELHEFMKSRGITADALKYMKLRHIDELFKGTRLSTKIIFEHKLREWQNKHGICEVSTTQSTLKTTTQTATVKPQIESALNQVLSKADTSTLSNRLMDAIQEAVNSVLTEFKASCKQSPQKHNDLVIDCSGAEIPQHEIVNKTIKNESPLKVNNDDISLSENVQKKVTRRRESLPQENHNETTIEQKTQLKTTVADRNDKSPKPSIETPETNNTLAEWLAPRPKKRRYDLGDSVEEILDMFPFGQRFKEEYRLVGILTPQQRTELVRTIVDYYIKNNQILTVRRCYEISEEILKLFPTECMETYFSQPNKKLPPKGKIWDRYQGRKRYMRKVISTKYKQTPQKNNTDTLDDTLDKANWSEMEALCSQMKTITNEKDLLAKWKESFAFRRYQLQSEWFTNWKLYFDEYPFVKQQNYAQYIDADLKTLYPNLKFNDFLWFEFLKNFKTFFLNRIKYPKAKVVFDTLLSMENLDTTSDYLAIKIVELLHAVLKTHHKTVQSIEESQRSFTVEVTDLADLKKVVIERKKQCTDNNLQAKPYIAVVGQNRIYTHFSVILDSTGFSCDNYKDALILCFNLYLFFDLSFPYETLGVWLFIQKYFFNKPSLVNNPKVETFINDIKAQKQITLDVKHGIFEK